MEENEFVEYTITVPNNEADFKQILDNFESGSTENKKMNHYVELDTIRRRLNNIMYLACYCGLCIEKFDNLTSIYTPFEISSVGSTTVQDMLTEVFQDTADLLASDFICDQCLDKTLQSYTFIQKTKQSVNVISEYINSFESKVITLEEQIEENVDYSETKFVILIEPNEGNMKEAPVIVFGDDHDENTNVDNEEMDEVTQTIQKSEKNDEPLGLLHDPIPDTIIYLQDDKVTPIKTKNDAFKCRICDVVMITFKEWKKHEHTYHKVDVNVPMTCQICFKVIANKRCLIQHYRRHNRSKCRHCNVVIPHLSLKSHMMDEHGIEPKEQKIFKNENSEIVDENQCVMCYKHFSDEEQLNMHQCKFKCTECPEFICIHQKYLMSFRQQVWNKSTKFFCPDCDYMCAKRDLLIGHANKAHLNHHYECNLCGAEYYSKTTLKYHTASAHAEHYICEYCDDELADEVEYKIHVQMCKYEKRDVECSFCKASFNTQEELNKHEELRHKMFPCGMCNKTFTTEHKQRDHTTKTHSGLERLRKKADNLQCPICEMKFDIRGEYTRHVTTHGPIYNCKDCDQQFDNRKYFLLHYMRAHKQKDLRRAERQKRMVKKEKLCLICDICGKVFSSRELFSAHSRRAHLEPVQCKICNKMVKQVSIYSHMRCHKQQMGLMSKRICKLEKKFQCDKCDFKAVSRQVMDTHINRVHLKIKPYKCEVCDVAYCSKYQLNEHVNINHIEENWQKCKLCDKVLRTSRGLKKHMMKHTGERPHVCEVCGQGYITITELTDHLKRHKGGKQTECPICESQHFSIKHLRLHIKRVHWKYEGKPFNPKLLKGLEGHEYIFQDKRIAVVE